MKKIITIVTSIVCVACLVGPGAANALTAEELQTQIVALQAQLTALIAQLGTLQGTTTPAATAFDTNLYFGLKNDKVKALQEFLIGKGYLAAGLNTSYFGNLTKAAVQAYQTAKGITPVAGYFGPLTRAAANADGGAPTTPTTPTTAGGLAVALSPVTPASTSIISYGATASKQAQVAIPFVTVNFTAGTGDVKVTNLKFNRTGIASDSSLAYTYLYDGSTKLTEGGSISAKVLTFNDATGLFTVPAGTTKSITLVGNLNSTAASGQTLGFTLVAATDVTSNATSVTGSFPATGNLMNIAAATDLGYALIAGSYATPATTTDVAAQTDATVWSFSLQAVNQNLKLEKLIFTEVGSITTSDLQNFNLYYGGTVLGSVATMNADRQVVIDMSAAPFSILSGNTKTLTLHADIISGATRTFAFTLQNATDILIKDTNYGVYVPTNLLTLSGTWSLVQPTDHYLISYGSLTVTKRTDSPTGNVPRDATGVLLAKYDFKAVGENIKVSNLRISADTTGAGGLDNGMVFLNGVQVGSTTDLAEYDATPTTFTFGNSFVVPAGTTALVEVKADIKTTAAASLTAGDTVTIYLKAGDYNNGQGVSSLTILDVPSTTVNKVGNALAVQVGSLTFTKNASYGAQSTTAPATQFKVGSFQMLAGSSEGVNVDSITVAISDTGEADIASLTLKIGDVQIGTTKVTPTTSNAFSVNVALAASEAKTVDVYADILSTAAADTAIDATGFAVTGTGTTSITSTAANVTTAVPLQVITVTTGALSVSYDAGNVLDSLVVGLTSGVQMAKYKFASSYEAFTVSEIKVYASSEVDRTSPRYAKSNLPDFLNVWLSYKDSTGATVTTSKRSTFVNGMMNFTGLSLYVPANGTASVTVYADLNAVAPAGYALTGDRPQISLAYYKASSGSVSEYIRRTGKLVYGEDGATVTPMTWVADGGATYEETTSGTGAYALQFVNAGQDLDDGAELDIPLSDLNLTVADFVTAGDLITFSAYSTVTNSVPMVTLFMDCDQDGSLDGEMLYSPTQTITASTWTNMSYATNTKTFDWWSNGTDAAGCDADANSGTAVLMSTMDSRC